MLPNNLNDHLPSVFSSAPPPPPRPPEIPPALINTANSNRLTRQPAMAPRVLLVILVHTTSRRGHGQRDTTIFFAARHAVTTGAEVAVGDDGDVAAARSARINPFGAIFIAQLACAARRRRAAVLLGSFSFSPSCCSQLCRQL